MHEYNGVFKKVLIGATPISARHEHIGLVKEKYKDSLAVKVVH
jgi:hypothetical protein